MKHAPNYPTCVFYASIYGYTNPTAVTVGFTEMTYSGDELDETTTLECIVIMIGQLERNLLIDISTEDDSATGLCFV